MLLESIFTKETVDAMVFPKRSRQQQLQLFRQIEPNAYYVDSKTMTCVCWQHFTEWSGRIDQCWETLQVLQQVHFIWRNTLWTSTCSVKKRNTNISMRNVLTSNVTDLTCRFLVSKAAVCRLVIVEKKSFVWCLQKPKLCSQEICMSD